MTHEMKDTLEILYEMGKRVGCPKSFFKPFKDGKKMRKEWYLKYSWTVKEQDGFVEWLTKRLTKKMPKPLARKNAEYFVFNYGWKFKD